MFNSTPTRDDSPRYHAHSGVQRVDGLYGGLVVHRPAAQSTSEMSTYQYDRELLLLVGDWYHRQAHEVLDYYLDWKNFGIEVSLVRSVFVRFNPLADMN